MQSHIGGRSGSWIKGGWVILGTRAARLGLLAFGLMLASLTAAAATWQVPGDFATLGAAVASAQVFDGDTIVIAAGTYAENVVVTKRLTILGPNVGIDPNTGTRVLEAVLIPATTDTDAGRVLDIQVSGVTIDGLTIDGSNPGAPLSGGPSVTYNGVEVNTAEGISNGDPGVTAWPPTSTNNPQIDHLTVQNTIFKNLAWQGIYIQVATTTNSAFNHFVHNLYDNLYEGVQTYSIHADVSDSHFTRAGRAVSMHQVYTDGGGFVERIADNVLDVSNTGGGSRQVGFWVNGRTAPAPALVVSGNTVNVPSGLPNSPAYEYRAFEAITVNAGESVTFSNNTVNGNNRCDVGFFVWNTNSSATVVWDGGALNGIARDGIYVHTHDVTWGYGSTQAATVKNTSITLGSSASGARVYIDPTDTTKAASLSLTNVSFTGGTTGLMADGANASLTAEGCTVTGATTGILTQNSGSAAVHLSRIAGNTAGASAASGSINATNNWWGCNAGPGGAGCDTVSGAVTYSPWLTLSLSAIPTTVPASGGTAALDANLFTNSAAANLFGTGTFPSTGSVAFGATAPHSVSPTPLTLSGGGASSTFTAGATQGSTSVTATLDGQIVSTSIIVGNPVPTITSLAPSSEPVGTPGFVALTVNGTGFVSGSVINWNGSPVGTLYNDPAQLGTLLTTTQMATAGIYPVTVTNPAPAGGISNAVDFTVNNPQPVLTSMTPAAIATGSAAFTLTLNGSGYVAGATVYWDGSALVTTFVSATKLTAAVPAANVAAVGSHTVQVENPMPNLGDSATLTFQVSTPTDVYVDDNYVGLALGTSVNWPYTGSGTHTIGLDAFATVQGGVSAVSSAGTVHVAAGTYPEQVLITRPVTMLGPNAGIAGYAARGPEALLVPPSILNLISSPREWNYDPVLDIESNQVVVDGIAVSCDNPALDGYHYAGMNIECGVGVYSEGNQVTFINSVVSKGTVIGFWAGGIYGAAHSGLMLANNAIDSIHDLNQVGYGFGAYVQATTGTVIGNRITNCRSGMQIQPYTVTGAPAVVTGNTVSGWVRGIYYNYAESGASAWTISGNTVSACVAPAMPTGPVGWVGVKAETMYNTANGGTISNNTVDGLAAMTDPAHTGWGGFAHPVWGFQYGGNASTSTQVLFTGNTVQNVAFGFVHDAPADIVLTGNSLTASDQAIVLQRSYSNAGVQQAYGGANNIDATGGNTINGVPTATATLAQLFAIEDAVRHKVDDPSLGLIRVKASNLYVTPNSFSPPATTTPSIQRAIDAATVGDTVNVGNGAYAETNLTINKALTVAGQSQAGVVIKPSTPDAHVDGSFPTGYNYAFLLQSGNVAIRSLTVDGDDTSNAHNFRAGVMTDHRLTTLFNNITVQNCTIQHTWRRGIQLFCNTPTQSSGHLVTGNTVDDVLAVGDPNAGTPDAVYCTGIVGFDTTDTTFSNNTVSNVLSAIESVQWAATGGEKVTVQGNTLSSVNTGVQLVVPADGTLVGGPNAGNGNTITLIEGARDNDGIIVRNATGTVTVQANTVNATGKANGLSMFGNSDPLHPVLVLNNTFVSTSSTSTTAGEGTGVFMSDDTRLFGDAGGAAQADLPTYATLTGNTVTGFVRGVDLYRNGITPTVGGEIVQATIGGTNPSTDSNSITAAPDGTGVRVFDADGAANGYKAVAAIENNRTTITGALVGVDVNGGNATLTLNAITGNGTGVLFHDGATGSATLNDLTGNTSFGIQNANTSGTIPATCNWWGNVTGPNHATNPGGTGSPVSNGLAFSTWAGAAYDCTTQYGVPIQLVFTVGPPTTTGAGVSFPVTVQAQDAAGNLAPGFNGAFGGVTLSLSGGTAGAVLTGGSANAVNGVATFTLSVDRGGTGYSLGAAATYGGSSLTGTSGTFDVTNPTPTLSTLSPTWARVDATAPFTLSLTGTNFVPTSTAYWGATALTTTYVDGTHLTAQVPGPLAVGSVDVTVVNGPPPSTQTSNAISFVVRDIPATVWVDQAWASHVSGDPVSGHTFGYDAFAVIQDGINAVATGGTVNVYPATYTENLSIAKTLALVGNFGSLPRPVVQSGGSGTNLALVGVSAPGVRIENMELQVDLLHYQDGIRATSGTPDGIVIRNNLLHSYNSAPGTQSSWPYNGINVGGTGSLVTIQGNTLAATPTIIGGFPYGVFGRGIWLHGARGLIGGPNSGDGNTLYGFRDVLAQFVTGGDLTIQGNGFTGGGLDVTEPNPGLKTISILGNVFSGDPGDGSGTLLIKNVYAADAAVLAQGNTFNGCQTGVWSGASRNVTLRGNTFTPPASGSFVHVRVDSAPQGSFSNTINGIALYGNLFNAPATPAGVAVGFFNSSALVGTTFPSITMGGAGADANTFAAGFATDILLDATAGHEFSFGPIGATQNLYDVGSGAKLPGAMTLAELFSLEDKVQHKVDDSTLGLVRVVPANLYVTPNSFVATFTTTPSIQRAIDAATAGDTVNVAAGSYAENLVVNKALNLLGPNAGTPGNGTRVAEALLLPSTVGPYALDPDHSTTILRATASNVTVRGFAFDGHNPALTGGTVIDSVEVHAAAGISNYADDHGYAVPVSGMTLEDSRFAHFGYCGIDFEGNNTTPSTNSLIQDNYFTSLDPGDAPVYGWGVGIVLAENGYADVLNNHGDNVRKGVQTNNFYRANTGTTARINDNTFETWRYGLYHNLHYSDASPFTISGNTFRAATGSTTNRGLGLSSLQGGVSATIQNNTIQGGFAGFEAWNIPVTTPLTIEGGSATGCQYGLLFWNNQVPGYGLADGNSFLNVVGTSLINSTGAGIRVFDDPANTNPACGLTLTATGCTVTGGPVGVSVENSRAGATITNSDLSNHASFGANNLGGTLIATCDWWGDATGPYNATLNPSGAGSPVSGGVTFVAWSTTPPPVYTCQGYVPPTLSSADITGPYTVGISQQFHVTAQNPALGRTYTNVRFDFTLQNTVLADIAAFDYTPDGGTTWLPMPLAQSGADVTGYFGPPAGFPLPVPYSATTAFRITVATAKSYPIVVQLNDLAGPATLATLTATASSSNPAPVLTSLSPSQLAPGQPSFILTLDGASFVPGAGAFWTAASVTTPLVTTYVSATQLTAAVPAALVAAAGTASVQIKNPAPNLGDSGPLTFTVSNPAVAYVNKVWDGQPAGAPVTANGGTHTIGYDAFAVIQDGLNAVAASGSVYVYPTATPTDGYAENLVIAKPLALAKAPDAGPTSVVIYPALSAPDPEPSTPWEALTAGASNVILVQANDVTIQNLTIDGDNPNLTSNVVRNGADVDARNGIIINKALGPFSNLSVHDCSVKNTYLRGIYAYNPSKAAIDFHDNIVDNIQGDNYYSIGIFSRHATGTVVHNTVSRCPDAVSANWSHGLQFLNNIVSNSGSGVHTDNSGELAGDVSDILQGNSVSAGVSFGGQPTYGVWAFAPYRNVTIQGNTVGGVDVGLAVHGQGAAAGEATFTDNTVDGQSRAGVRGAIVSTELIGDNGWSNVKATFTGNTIQHCAEGIFVADSVGFTASVSAHGNNLALNAPYGFNNTATTVADATCNWWGDATGPVNAANPGATITNSPASANVTFAPWSSPDPAHCLGGAPAITGITDNDPCATDGILVTFTAAPQATSHDLLKDGLVAVTGYVSGALYAPGDTATHVYVVRAHFPGAQTLDSAGSSFADVNDTPAAVTNVLVTNPDCTGALITFTASGAQSYELWVDSVLIGPAAPAGTSYTPADGAIHNYVIRAINNTCHADSAPVSFAVTNLTPPRVTDSLMLTKVGNNMLLSWALILPATVVDYYEVGRFLPQAGGPPIFDAVIGTASGQVDGIQVTLSGEPANANYLVRAVKGNCRGPWE